MGYSVTDLLVVFTVSDLAHGGIPLRQLKAAKIDLCQLTPFFFAKQLYSEGYSAEQLKPFFSTAQLADGNIPICELDQAGISVVDLLEVCW
mmetsp:Transcript_39987/g.89792  ORF Transcript_39987/g.89792 Transcript_39987/m.89792 type:complete len:91 (-) Transcript_39987:156-428(-)